MRAPQSRSRRPGLHAPAAGASRAVAALPAGLFRNVLAGPGTPRAQARARVNVLPLGSGALAGSGFPFDREAIARDLGFAAVTNNSMDVSADRDFALDFLYAASTTMLHLSRLAEDWILYSSEEFGWLELADDVTSGSSLMPQKKNPDSLELIRGKSGRVFGDLTSLFVTMKGLPSTYNRDMQEDKQPLFDAAHQLSGSLEMMARRDRLGTSQSGAAGRRGRTELGRRHRSGRGAGPQGTPFHQAHQIVGRLVLESVRAGQAAFAMDRGGAHAICSGVQRRR